MTTALIRTIQKKYVSIHSCLSEKGKRLWAAAEAISYGRGGASLVSKATAISRTTIHKGINELREETLSNSGIRKNGGGRKKATEKNSTLLKVLDSLVEPTAKEL